MHVLGIAPTQSLPIRDALIGSLSAMFALMVAFSAAGSWSDAVQARAAVQREANSIENIIAIAWSFPNEFRIKFTMRFCATPIEWLRRTGRQ